jgi:hypothetical protein
MKKLTIIIAALLLPLLAGAQAQNNTKKVKISDFTQKVTKVVLSGNSFYDTSLKDEISARWRISPYEFCTLEEFESFKTDDQYYFLMSTYGQFKKETAPGIQFLTLVKGGKGADKSIDEMLEIVSVPLASAEYPSGRELVFLPAILDIIQNHTLESMEKDLNAYGGLASYNSNLSKATYMKIVFSEDDINPLVTKGLIAQSFDEDMMITDEEDADMYISDNAAGTLVSYVVAPSEPVSGSFCYKMLIDSQTHALYYYKRHKISEKTGPGFLPEDIKKIASHRKKR